MSAVPGGGRPRPFPVDEGPLPEGRSADEDAEDRSSAEEASDNMLECQIKIEERPTVSNGSMEIKLHSLIFHPITHMAHNATCNVNACVLEICIRLDGVIQRSETSIDALVALVHEKLCQLPLSQRKKFMVEEVRTPFIRNLVEKGVPRPAATGRWNRLRNRLIPPNKHKGTSAGRSCFNRVSDTLHHTGTSRKRIQNKASKDALVVVPVGVLGTHAKKRTEGTASLAAASFTAPVDKKRRLSLAPAPNSPVISTAPSPSTAITDAAPSVPSAQVTLDARTIQAERRAPRTPATVTDAAPSVPPAQVTLDARTIQAERRAPRTPATVRLGYMAGRESGLVSFHLAGIDQLSVVATNDIFAGSILGLASGVVVDGDHASFPSSVPLARGMRLLLTSGRGTLTHARLSSYDDANAYVNENAEVVALADIRASAEVVLHLPRHESALRDTSVSDIIDMVVTKGVLWRFPPEDPIATLTSQQEIVLSSDHTAAMKPLAAHTCKAAARVLNYGSSAASICINGSDTLVPSRFGVLVPADCTFKMCPGAPTTAAFSVSIVSCQPISSDMFTLTSSLHVGACVLALPEVDVLDVRTRRVGTRPRAQLPFQFGSPPPARNVVVRPSLQASGDGIFAACEFDAGSHLCTYFGSVYHTDEWPDIEPQYRGYGASVPHNYGGRSSYVCDARVSFGGHVGRFINQAPTGVRPNAALRWVELSERIGSSLPTGYISVFSTRRLVADEEIFMAYGPGHIFNGP